MIPQIPFGRTGHLSSRAIFGAAAFWDTPQDEADATMALLESYGINHVDTAASYGDSELKLGSWIARHGRPSFLATKSGERTGVKAREELFRSLERLHMDHVDLWQLHFLLDPAEWEVAMGPGGVLEAAIEARREGLVRFIGVTGHEVQIAERHLASLRRFDFDSVLLPYSHILMQEPRYAQPVEELLRLCAERSVAVQTIKGIVCAPWGDRPHTRTTWYEPLEDQADIDLAVHWILGQPGVFLNTVGDIHLLPRVLEAVSRFEQRPAEAEMQALLQRRQMQPLFT
jgi:aryl-alcohol dehydrogenase-like predicted oxidoreductase